MEKKYFAQECFIRKNTPELREALKNIGYEICLCTEFEDSGWLTTSFVIGTPTVHGIGYWDDTVPFKKEGVYDFFLHEMKESNHPRIDCGEDEEFFLMTASKTV